MARKPRNRVVGAITDLMWERDKAQMQAINALLSVVAPSKRRPAKPKARRQVKRRRRSSTS